MRTVTVIVTVTVIMRVLEDSQHDHNVDKYIIRVFAQIPHKNLTCLT